MASPFKLTTDGYEIQWQTNHLAPFLLSKTLFPILESTAASSNSKDRVRIINVASDGAMMRPTPRQLDLAHPNLEYLTGATDTWYATPLHHYLATTKTLFPQTTSSFANYSPGNATAIPKSLLSSTPAAYTTASVARVYRPTAFTPASSLRTYSTRIPAVLVLW